MKVYVFGEILFDRYPDKAVIGGAPFNFCAHLAKLGGNATLLSAVGADALGQKALKIAQSHGFDLSKMQTNAYSTGVCDVILDDNGVPSYKLLEDVAYDHITLSDAAFAAIKADTPKALYFGTLALRHPDSTQTLRRLLAECDFNEVFFDINIRPPHSSKESILLGLQSCTVLKCSREEAGIFTSLGITKTEYLLPLCKQLTDRFPNIHTVLMTLDADGAFCYDAKADHFTPSAIPKCEVVSTVGAGDSFFAGYVNKFLAGRSVKESLQAAIDLSSYVVSHTEAVPEYDDCILKKLQ